MHIVLSRDGADVLARRLDDGDRVVETTRVTAGALAQWVAAAEDAVGTASDASADHPRWVWNDTVAWYPSLLAAGVRVDRCVDLRLCHAILRRAGWTAASDLATAVDDPWDAADAPSSVVRAGDAGEALFDLDAPAPVAQPDPLAEFLRQRVALAGAEEPGRLGLLLAAESAGALVAAELRHVGVPWRADRHDELLTALLGPRPAPGLRPAELERLLGELRAALDDPTVDPDSPGPLLRSLQHAGIRVDSTRSWELKEIKHPAIAPLLEYKKLARLLTANGWNWLDEWVRDGRFRPTYLPGGVVTGRWASDGGGAMQLPKQVRGAVVADPGWTLVVADAAQLEPRVLAAMSRDTAMAAAGREADLYEGMVRTGAVSTRSEAKYGMLGAIYGGSTGVSARVLPQITRAYPKAMGLVEHAAREGEEGRTVQTWLGRTSPAGRAPGWDETLSAAQQRDDRSRRRAWGRFTRNFVVQGTAAEWALCWMASLRRRLWELDGPGESRPLEHRPLESRPHLAFFLHDELMVHTPLEHSDTVAELLRESAAEAGRLLFGGAPVEFPVTVAVVDSYDLAK